MCCFSRPVRSVRDTGIFARNAADGRQLLAYTASLSADEDLAMVLPLPVPPGTPEGAVRFVDLSEDPHLFGSLASLFAPPDPVRLSLPFLKSAPTAPLLEVVRVGSFVASFVPTVADFARLDPRFQLPAGTWEGLPAYRDYGFVVVALSPGEQALHPMALEFPRRDPHKIFFPTVHIHDGQVHAQARFDHALYLQEARGERLPLHDWEESREPVHRDFDGAGGLLLPGRHVYRLRISGYMPNTDTYV
jgi:hypothetical protein